MNNLSFRQIFVLEIGWSIENKTNALFYCGDTNKDKLPSVTSTNLCKTITITSGNIIDVVMTTLVLFINKLKQMNKYFMKKEIKFSYVRWIFLDNNPTKCCNCAGNVIQIVVVLALTLTIIDFIFRAIVIRFQLTFSMANFCILVMHSAWLGPVPLLGILPLQLETRNCL